MKKILVMTVAAMVAVGAFAAPHGHGGWHRPPPPSHHHHGGHSFWGHGGCNFWPGFVGGVVGGAVVSSVVRPAPVAVAAPVVTTPIVSAPVVAAPVVVSTPVVTTPAVVTPPVVAAPVSQVQNVWVEGRYIDQVQANGTVVRVWQPGHYEQRTVIIQ